MLQIPRTFSRCNQIWVLPSKPNAASLALKDVNYFPSFGSVNTLESWIQIGSTKFPSKTYGPGTAEHLYQYQKALGFTTSGFHVSSNTNTAYNHDSMIIIFSTSNISPTGDERTVDALEAMLQLISMGSARLPTRQRD